MYVCVQLEAESRLAAQLRALEARAERDRADRSQADQLKRSETKLSKRMSSLESSLHRELQLLKQEYDKGGRSLSVYLLSSVSKRTRIYYTHRIRQGKKCTRKNASPMSRKERDGGAKGLFPISPKLSDLTT